MPITLIAASPNMLLVHPSVPANTLNELITYAKSRPGQLNYASTGNGGTGHLAMEMLKAMAGLQITHIPFKGGAPAMLAQLSGEVPLGFNNVVAAMPHVKAGKLRALGVTGAKRLSLTPDLPTIAEAGVAGFEAVAWFGTFAPPGTPPAALAALRTGYSAAMSDPGLVEHAVKTTGLPYDPVSAETGKAVLAALSTVSPEIVATVRRSIDALGK